jgi:CRISPR-associated protein Cmr1
VPPFKALLRHWWRIVWWASAAEKSIGKLREEERCWFGSSAENETGASKIRIWLKEWSGPVMRKDQFNRLDFGTVRHPEVNRNISAALYLGYGAVNWNKAARSAQLVRSSALGLNGDQELRLAFPKHISGQVDAASRMIALFGCLGGRSRNGWGSISLKECRRDGEMAALVQEEFFDEENQTSRGWLRGMAVELDDALKRDWCHALGKDRQGRLLLWRTERKKRWEEVLAQLAEVKIGLRTQFHFKGAGPHNTLCDRQLLAYPVTNHGLQAWGNSARSANQLVFKVHAVDGGYVGVVVHLPHSLPAPLMSRLEEQLQLKKAQVYAREKGLWNKVHKYLDSKLTRLS